MVFLDFVCFASSMVGFRLRRANQKILIGSFLMKFYKIIILFYSALLYPIINMVNFCKFLIDFY
jgi:hypothetical protein